MNYTRPIVITEREAHRQNIINTIFMVVLVFGSLMGGIEIGKQEVQKKLITDLQDGKVECEVQSYSNKKEKFTEVRLGRLAREVGKLE